MYNYGVVNNSYVIVMKRYKCSLKDWLNVKTEEEGGLENKENRRVVLRMFREVLGIIRLLH